MEAGGEIEETVRDPLKTVNYVNDLGLCGELKFHVLELGNESCLLRITFVVVQECSISTARCFPLRCTMHRYCTHRVPVKRILVA